MTTPYLRIPGERTKTIHMLANVGMQRFKKADFPSRQAWRQAMRLSFKRAMSEAKSRLRLENSRKKRARLAEIATVE